MKKYIAFFASAALMMAACAKEEVNTPVETPVVGETELITVELNPDTKTYLSGTATKWSKGDAVSVIVGTRSVGTLTLDGNSGTNVFSGEIEAGLSGEAILAYPADVTSAPKTQKATYGNFVNGAALLEGTTTIENLRVGNGTTLKNKTALLKFKTPVAGNVVFNIGGTNYTVTECEGKINAESNYMVCVDPVENVSLSYTLEGKEGAHSKESVTFEAGKIYNLGNLEVKKYVYLVPNVNWVSDGAWFAAYFFDNGETWVEMESIGNGVYRCAVPVGYPSVIFCRMKKDGTLAQGWNAKTDQTNDLAVPSGEKNYYYIEGWNKSNASKWESSSFTSSYFPDKNKRYLLPQNDWAKGDERYAAYFFEGDNNTWVSMTQVTTGCKYLTTSYYEVTPPKNYSNVIFCRMNKNQAANNWNNKWEQTGDLKVSDGHLYTVSKKNNTQTGSWSNF